MATPQSGPPPPEVLEKIAEQLGAPPGTIPNYVDPQSIGSQVVIPTIVLGILAVFFVLLRVYTKVFISKALRWDDYFSVGAALCAIARAVISCLLVYRFGIGRHLWDVDPVNYSNIRNLQWIQDMIYLLGILCVKLSILLLYLNLFRPNKKFRYLCYVVMAANVAYCIICIFLYAFNCEPQYYTWHVVLNAPAKCIPIVNVIMAIGGVNLVTDLVILIMPLPLIWRLNLRPNQKWGLLAIFLTGTFIVATTIARLVIVVETIQEVDQSYKVVPEIIWLTVELDMAIICGCLPALAPVYTGLLKMKIIPSSLRNLLSSRGSSRSWFSRSPRSTSKNSSLHSNDVHKKGDTSSHNSDEKLVQLDPKDTFETKVEATGGQSASPWAKEGRIGMQRSVEQYRTPRGEDPGRMV